MTDGSSSDGTNLPRGEGNTPPDLYEVRISGSRDTIARVLKEFDLDVGCRHPHVDAAADGSATLRAYASDARIRELEAAGYRIEKGENVSALARERQAEVGKGDRFEGGRVPPRGLGGKPGSERKGGSCAMTFLNVVEIESALSALGGGYPTHSQLITLPYRHGRGAAEPRPADRHGRGSLHRPGVLIISGAHAREWGGPDILVNLAADLLEAYASGHRAGLRRQVVQRRPR